MALSADFILQVAPGLTASTSNIDAGIIADRALILSIVTGLIALSMAYFMVRKSIVLPAKKNLIEWENSKDSDLTLHSEDVELKKGKKSNVFAALVPFTFLAIVGYVVIATFSNMVPSIEDGAGASLIGGTAVLLLLTVSLSRDYRHTLKEVSDYLVSGFVFAFKVMGLVIPIAGFFFIGSGNFSGKILGIQDSDQAPAYLFDLVQISQQAIPENVFVTGFGILLLGMIFWIRWFRLFWSSSFRFIV